MVGLWTDFYPFGGRGAWIHWGRFLQGAPKVEHYTKFCLPAVSRAAGALLVRPMFDCGRSSRPDLAVPGSMLRPTLSPAALGKYVVAQQRYVKSYTVFYKSR